MSKCKYLIDISPYTPLCEHPCRLYGGGPVEANCDACEYRTESFEVENAKLRELVRDMFGVISRNNTWWDGNAKDTSRLSDRMRELGIEVDE